MQSLCLCFTTGRLAGILRRSLHNRAQLVRMQIGLADFPYLDKHSFVHCFFLNGMAAADTSLGEPLIHPSDKEHPTQQHFAVEFRHSVAALVAEDQPFQKEVVDSDPSVLTAVH